MAIHEMFPYLCVSDAARAIDFYVKAFGAREKLRLVVPSGRVGHAELDFGGRTLMLAEEFPEYGLRTPTSTGATPVTIHPHVDDADALIQKAAALGAMQRSIRRTSFTASVRERSVIRLVIVG